MNDYDEHERDLFCAVYVMEYELSRETHAPQAAIIEAVYAARRAVETYRKQFTET